MIKLLSIAIFAGLFFASNQKPVHPSNGWWTEWFNRDNPGGSGDWELLSYLRNENPGKICPYPTDIEALTLTGLSPAAARDVIFKSDTTEGFICRNKDQRRQICNDYRVRFFCPFH